MVVYPVMVRPTVVGRFGVGQEDKAIQGTLVGLRGIKFLKGEFGSMMGDSLRNVDTVLVTWDGKDEVEATGAAFTMAQDTILILLFTETFTFVTFFDSEDSSFSVFPATKATVFSV